MQHDITITVEAIDDENTRLGISSPFNRDISIQLLRQMIKLLEEMPEDENVFSMLH